MTIRTRLKAGAGYMNHSEALQVRTALKAGRKAGGTQHDDNHNETLQRAADRQTVSMRRELVTTSRKEDRLELLVVRAGLRAGRSRVRSCARD
jgi:hypothetical protein